MQQDPGDGQAVFLAAGQAGPPLAHDRVVAIRELADPMVEVRRPGVNRYTGTVQWTAPARDVKPVGGVPIDSDGEQASAARAREAETDAVPLDGPLACTSPYGSSQACKGQLLRRAGPRRLPVLDWRGFTGAVLCRSDRGGEVAAGAG